MAQVRSGLRDCLLQTVFFKSLKGYARRITVGKDFEFKTETTQGRGDYSCRSARMESFTDEHENFIFFQKTCMERVLDLKY